MVESILNAAHSPCYTQSKVCVVGVPTRFKVKWECSAAAMTSQACSSTDTAAVAVLCLLSLRSLCPILQHILASA